MKKITAFILVIMLCFSLCACNSNANNANKTEKEPVLSENSDNISAWTSDVSVDEFGDVTANSSKILKTLISGNFSNTATSDSNLAGYAYIMPDPTGLHFTVVFKLLEYGNNPVSYFSSDKITLKTKINNEVEDFSLTGIAPTGDLYLGAGIDNDDDGDDFIENLYGGNDIKCIINIGSSQYNFDISSKGFLKTFNENYGLNSLHDALKVFDSKYRRAAIMYFLKNVNELPPLNTEELSTILPGYWKSKEIETNSYTTLYNYTQDGKIISLGNIINNELKSKDKKEWSYSIEGSLLTRNDGCKFEYFKITEGYYLVKFYSSWGANYLYIYTQCDANGTAIYNYN